MVSTKYTLFLIISIIVVVFNDENTNADETDPSMLFEFAFKTTSQTGIQTPLQFCSSERAPNPSGEELKRLSALGLDAPLSTESDKNNSSEDLGMILQTDNGASSFKDFDLNLTIEEYNEMVKKKKKMKSTY